MDDLKIKIVIDKFFDALKNKTDYEIEGTGLTYFATLDLIKAAASESIKNNPEAFEDLVKWFVNASMYLLNDIEDLDDIDLQLRSAI
jgi:hypothetical protein|tara:strand:- start:236 stop:496 length:261 start_codon:yes stop_codon:yes gene_type:complete